MTVGKAFVRGEKKKKWREALKANEVSGGSRRPGASGVVQRWD
jgi:hypothetical protein